MQFDLIEARGGEFEVMRTSDGAPSVVLLPSAAGGVQIYQDLLNEIAALSVDAMAINPRGCGGSSELIEDARLEDLAEDAIGVVEASADTPVVLAGHAGGNRIARLAARLRPDLVAGVVLLAAGGKFPAKPEALEAMAGLRDPSLGDEGLRETLRRCLYAKASEIKDSFLRPADQSSAYRRVFTAANAGIPVEDWWDGGSRPMLVIQGKEDRIAPIANGHDLRDTYPERVSLIDLDNAGHMIPCERPKTVARIVSDFASDLGVSAQRAASARATRR